MLQIVVDWCLRCVYCPRLVVWGGKLFRNRGSGLCRVSAKVRISLAKCFWLGPRLSFSPDQYSVLRCVPWSQVPLSRVDTSPCVRRWVFASRIRLYDMHCSTFCIGTFALFWLCLYVDNLAIWRRQFLGRTTEVLRCIW